MYLKYNKIICNQLHYKILKLLNLKQRLSELFFTMFKNRAIYRRRCIYFKIRVYIDLLIIL